MIFEVVQRGKDLFSADFDIIRGNCNIGALRFQGRMGSMEAECEGKIGGHVLSMEHSGAIKRTHKRAFRPYAVELDGREAGVIFQEDIRESIFSVVSIISLEAGGRQFELYPIAMRQEGFKNPVFCGGRQIIQIEKPAVVYDDLHSYRVFAVNESDAWIAVVLCSYMYVNACFKPGTKTVSGVQRVSMITKNKFLLSKYDPSFKQRVGD